jgi:hypothetical protein
VEPTYDIALRVSLVHACSFPTCFIRHFLLVSNGFEQEQGR